MESSFEYRKAPLMLQTSPVNVVQENSFLRSSDALLRLVGSHVSRYLLVLITYSVCVSGSLWLAYQFRFDFDVPPAEMGRLRFFLAWMIPLKLAFLLLLVQFDGLLSYFGIPDLRRLALSLTTASLVLMTVWWLSAGKLAPPRGVIVADLLVSFLVLSSVRLFLRMTREKYALPAKEWNGRIQRVGIVGAGDVGAALARDLSIKGHLALRPVAFLDDDPQKWHSHIHNIPVVGAPECLLSEGKNLKLDKVFLAAPYVTKQRRGEIIQVLRKAQIKFETVPSFDQLTDGGLKLAQSRPVRPRDLFGKNPLPQLERDKIRELIHGKVIMITGAGGSVGSELCRQIAPFGPRQLLLVEQCEVQIFQIEQEMIRLGYQSVIQPLVADILDEPRMRSIFRRYGPEVIFHAAAHKHLSMMESHPCEAIQTHSFGTHQMAGLALEHRTAHFILISSNKAERPKSALGASQRLAESIVQALSADPANQTKFLVVRFGELAGPSDSIVQRFNKQIESGGPVKIAHPNALCHAMGIPEAVGLILQSVVVGDRGEILVLDMGKPIKLLDLACKMIELSGLRPDQDIEIEFTGLGSEGIEESACNQAMSPTRHLSILRLESPAPGRGTVEDALRELAAELYRGEPDELKLLLKRVVPEYEPSCALKNQEPHTPDCQPCLV